MKRILKTVALVLSVCLVSHQARSQTYELQIDSIAGIPDTVFNGQEVTFFMVVSMNTPLFYQGDMFIELEYGGQFYTADSSMTANNFIGPNSPNTIQASYIFTTDNDLSIGDNVVVVWPRLGDGTSPPQVVLNPYETIVTLLEPNGISDNPKKDRKPLFYPNPANTTIRLFQDQVLDANRIEVHDAFGRTVISSGPASQLNVSQLPVGMYSVSIVLKNGTQHTERLVIFH